MKNEGEQYYRNAPKGVQFMMRFIAMLVVVIILTAIAKGLSWALGADFTDMLIVVFFASSVMASMKRSIHK